MKKLVIVVALLAVAACGRDGEPVAPEVKGTTTFGMNSDSGPFQSSAITFIFGGPGAS